MIERRREYLIEFTPRGRYIKVAAIDPITNIEVSIVGDATTVRGGIETGRGLETRICSEKRRAFGLIPVRVQATAKRVFTGSGRTAGRVHMRPIERPKCSFQAGIYADFMGRMLGFDPDFSIGRPTSWGTLASFFDIWYACRLVRQGRIYDSRGFQSDNCGCR